MDGKLPNPGHKGVPKVETNELIPLTLHTDIYDQSIRSLHGHAAELLQEQATESPGERPATPSDEHTIEALKRQNDNSLAEYITASGPGSHSPIGSPTTSPIRSPTTTSPIRSPLGGSRVGVPRVHRRKSKTQKQAEKDRAMLAQALLDQGQELPAVALEDEARLEGYMQRPVRKARTEKVTEM